MGARAAGLSVFVSLWQKVEKKIPFAYNGYMEKNLITKTLRAKLASQPDYKDQIKILREAFGMTQEDLAKKVNRTSRSIRNIETGEAFPRISTLQEIARALNAKLKIELIPDDEPAASPQPKAATKPGEDKAEGFIIGIND